MWGKARPASLASLSAFSIGELSGKTGAVQDLVRFCKSKKGQLGSELHLRHRNER